MRWLLVPIVFAAACDRPPSGEPREWTARDHDQAELNGRQPMPPASVAAKNENDETTLTELTWSENCVSCHGPGGRGDGPNGALVRAPDLTRPEWQDSVTDQQIADQIRNGKGLMPKFDIPDAAIKGLIARIRASKR